MEVFGFSTCRLCGQVVKGTMGMLLRPQSRINQRHAGKAADQIAGLVAHLETFHVAEMHHATQLGQSFFAFIALGFFTHTDPAIQQSLDQMRWQSHNYTAPCAMPDSRIEDQTRKLAARLMEAVRDNDLEDGRAEDIVYEVLLPVLKGFRDVLQEPAKYPAVGAKTEPEIEPTATI